jgi:hypothetical protein
MYTTKNFKTKKELKEAIARGEKITIYQPGPFSGQEPRDGSVVLEGPHYPEPHKWYATGVMKDGFLISVK